METVINSDGFLDVILSAQQPEQKAPEQSPEQNNATDNNGAQPQKEPSGKTRDAEPDFEAVKKWFKTKNIDIKDEKDIEDLSFLDKEVSMFYKYKKETGRSIDDYINMQNVLNGVESISDTDDLIKKLLKEENPIAAEDDMLESIFEKKYKIKSEEDKDDIYLDQDEKNEIKKHNEKAAKNRQELIERYKERLKAQAENYRIPSEKLQYEKYKQELKNSYKEFVSKQKSINFALSEKEVYPFVLDEQTTKNVIVAPDEWIASLKNDDGSFDQEKLFKAMTFIANMDKILPIVYNHGFEKGKLDVLQEQTNPTNTQTPPSGQTASSAEIIKILFG